MGNDYELKFLKLENEKLKREIQQDQNINLDDIKELVDVASEMRTLLILCRKEQINISVAKRIDSILNRAKNID